MMTFFKLVHKQEYFVKLLKHIFLTFFFKFVLPAVPWRWRVTCLTCSRPSSPPCSPVQQGFRWPQPGQVSCSFSSSCVFCSACSPTLVVVVWPLPLHSLLSSSSFPLSSACLDPFTSAEAGDDSMPNLNPFLSKLVVDATHLPVVSSDGVSFSSMTSGHEMFGGNDSFLFLSLMSRHSRSFLCSRVCSCLVCLFLCCCSLNVDYLSLHKLSFFLPFYSKKNTYLLSSMPHCRDYKPMLLYSDSSSSLSMNSLVLYCKDK